jgi:UDP-N-acetylglucosamine 2-epimerase (hydrolysing)
MTSYLFLTGTRADFGKLKPLILAAKELAGIEVRIFATGMHLQTKYGRTLREVEQLGIATFPFVNFSERDSTAQIVAKTVSGLDDYLSSFPADFLVIHGDRPEALAGAIVGSMNNVRVIHVEGGELSGTVDESIRHAVTKLSHIHLVSNAESKARVIGLGENPNSVYEIGSPELDVMLSDRLPSLFEVRSRYELDDKPHCIFILHPVTTQDPNTLRFATRRILEIIKEQNPDIQILVILPNNDFGSDAILEEISKKAGSSGFRILPSMRFEHYLTLLKYAEFIVGNSSSGVREAPVFGTPSINIGSRQNRRASSPSIFQMSEFELDNLKSLLPKLRGIRFPAATGFGKGEAAPSFAKLIVENAFANFPVQKQFFDD